MTDTLASPPSIVTTAWLAENANRPDVRVVDVTTYLLQPGAVSGFAQALPYDGPPPTVAGAAFTEISKFLTGEQGDGAVAIDGTTMRLTIHPSQDGPGVYKFWSGRESYAESHIPGAVYADINDFNDPTSSVPYTAVDHKTFAERAGALGLGDPDTTIVLYDQGVGISFWASRLWWQFRLEGFPQVAVLEGGYRKWRAEGRPSATGEELLPPTTFDWSRRPELRYTTEDVEAAINDPDKLIIDSLSAAEYAGTVSGFGGRGHIPSSVNVSCNDHTEPGTSTLLNQDELKQRLTEQGVLNQDRTVVAYCGGGIGATWNALVLDHLGKKDVAIYDGSMFEWSSDPDRPLEASSRTDATRP